MFTQMVTPRFGDIDGLGHVNNNVVGVWFELARNPLFRIFSPDLELTYEKWNLIMARTEFDFLGEMFYNKDVEIITYIIRIGNSSFTVGHEAWQDGQIKAKGKAVIVHYDFINKRSVSIPEEIRESLREHLYIPEAEDDLR